MPARADAAERCESALPDWVAAGPEPRVPNDLFDLRGEVAVVLGGTGTLGGVMAEALGVYGARVAVLGRDESRGLARCERIVSAGGVAEFWRADALDERSLRDAADAVADRLGPPSVLVNAAGGHRAGAVLGPGDSVCDIPLDAWRGVFDLNLIGGALLPSLVFGREMVAAGRGSIVSIASMAGMNPVTRVGAYSSAKAAVINLTRYLAIEWAPRGVRVNSISPGFFPAEQNRSLLATATGAPTERAARILDHTPMARFGAPSELAAAIVWLAAPRASSFVTGHNLVVDGGFSVASV